MIHHMGSYKFTNVRVVIFKAVSKEQYKGIQEMYMVSALSMTHFLSLNILLNISKNLCLKSVNETGKVKVKDENQEKSEVAPAPKRRRSDQPRYGVIITGSDQFHNINTKTIIFKSNVSDLYTGNYRLIIQFTQ